MIAAQITGYPGSWNDLQINTRYEIKNAKDFRHLLNPSWRARDMFEHCVNYAKQSDKPVVFVGTFGESDQYIYPKLPAEYTIWLDEPLQGSLEQYIKSRMKYNMDHFDTFIKNQRISTSNRINHNLEMEYNLKSRMMAWHNLKSIYTNELGFEIKSKQECESLFKN